MFNDSNSLSGRWFQWCFHKGLPSTYWWMMPVCGYMAETSQKPAVAVAAFWAFGPWLFWAIAIWFGSAVLAVLGVFGIK
jgi:hypothetical protein